MGMAYNLYPINSSGVDTTGVISHKDINNEAEEEVQRELLQTVKSLLELKK